MNKSPPTHESKSSKKIQRKFELKIHLPKLLSDILWKFFWKRGNIIWIYSYYWIKKFSPIFVYCIIYEKGKKIFWLVVVQLHSQLIYTMLNIRNEILLFTAYELIFLIVNRLSFCDVSNLFCSLRILLYHPPGSKAWDCTTYHSVLNKNSKMMC